MDGERGDPARRRRLLSPPGGQGQGQLPRAAPTDLFTQFQRRFSQPLVLPPSMATPGPAAASGSGLGFSCYQQGTSAIALAASGGGSRLPPSLSPTPLLSRNQLAPIPYAGAQVTRFPLASPGAEQGSSSALPPRGAGHRRSRSDFFFGSSNQNISLPVPPAADSAALDGAFGSYRAMGELSSVAEDLRAWRPADSSANKAENWATAGGRGGPSNSRHCRSLSVDSFISNLSFGAMGQESSPRLPQLSSPGAGTSGGILNTGSGPSGGVSALYATDVASAEFSEAERQKIVANERLSQLVQIDPKRVKRILANRLSAAKSKERKMKYMGELERRVRVLEMETSTLCAKVAREQRESEALKNLNNEMKIRMQAMEQQAQLKCALNEAMKSEVQRLKHAIGETSDPCAPTSSHQHMGHQMTPQQLQQLQNQSSEAHLARQQQEQNKNETD